MNGNGLSVDSESFCMAGPECGNPAFSSRKRLWKICTLFLGMVLLLLFLEPMLKLTGTDGMITKLYEGNLAKEDQAEKELLQKLYESADLTEILPEEYQTSEEGADEKSQKKVSETQAVEVEEIRIE